MQHTSPFKKCDGDLILRMSFIMRADSGHHVLVQDEAQLQGSGNGPIMAPTAMPEADIGGC